MADREKHKGKVEIQKFEHLGNGKSFSDGIKSILHSIWRAIYDSVKKMEIWWKLQTQALTI